MKIKLSKLKENIESVEEIFKKYPHVENVIFTIIPENGEYYENYSIERD